MHTHCRHKNEKYQKVCFIGAPGAGKSTLIKSYVRQCHRRLERVYTEASIKKRIVKECYFRQGAIKQKLQYRTGTQIFIPALQKDYYVLLFKRLAKRNYAKQSAPYLPLLEMGWQGLTAEVANPANRLAVSAFLLRIAQEEILIDSIVKDKRVLFDDSIWQTLSNVRDYIESQPDPKAFVESLPKPDAVVFCHTDEKIVQARIRERAEKGRLNNSHKGLTLDQIAEATRRDIECARYKAELFRSCGVPVCEIDLTDPGGDQADRLDQFLSSLNGTAS